MIGSLPEVSSIESSPAPENEGCYLQGAIPHTARHGIPGHYATDPAQHHVESSRYDTLETAERLARDWDRWFAPGGDWRVEKSPVNLTRMRLYQSLFPMAQFVVVLRHPSAMAAALAKWTDVPAEQLIDYALDAYELALADTAWLHATMVLRYEDLVRGMDQAVLPAFLGLRSQVAVFELRDGNGDYPDAPSLTAAQASRAQAFGYADGLAVAPWRPLVRHPLRDVRERVEALI